ncbi:MAG: hypothetical protein GX825_01970, partial [Syntrophomonadaceae bacterium]|nr:hypothetical protein [Syntrophomonadaceae bacterium]
VLREFLPPGINYDNGWVEEFLTLLDREGICYLDNTGIMIEKSREGEILFNRKYNAMHWNDLGAYYGMNNLLGKLKKDFPALHINRPEDFVITEKLNTTLPVSEFPIHEYEPLYFLRTELLNNTDEFKDKLILHPMYRDFDYRINTIRQKEGAPRVLVFQGSYVTGMGYKFLANSFGEYIAIHCYQNVFDLDYYFDLFQPDCVIFETAEFTLSDTYFSPQGMENFDLEAGK